MSIWQYSSDSVAKKGDGYSPCLTGSGMLTGSGRWLKPSGADQLVKSIVRQLLIDTSPVAEMAHTLQR